MRCASCGSIISHNYGIDLCRKCLRTPKTTPKFIPKGRFDMRAVAGNVVRRR
jgi:hypothetical protein